MSPDDWYMTSRCDRPDEDPAAYWNPTTDTTEDGDRS